MQCLHTTSGRVAKQANTSAFSKPAHGFSCSHNVGTAQATCGSHMSRSLACSRPEPFKPAAAGQACRSRRATVRVANQAGTDKLTVTITGERALDTQDH
jgi:hypothetical protein